jgi:hypothetical protein
MLVTWGVSSLPTVAYTPFGRNNHDMTTTIALASLVLCGGDCLLGTAAAAAAAVPIPTSNCDFPVVLTTVERRFQQI